MQEPKIEEDYLLVPESPIQNGANFKTKIGLFWGTKYFNAVLISLSILLAFLLGRVSVVSTNRPPVRVIDSQKMPIENSNSQNLPNSAAAVSGLESLRSEEVVGSKNGTKYHYPWCAGAKQISAKNLITFKSIEEARASGYTPASNCKGLK